MWGRRQADPRLCLQQDPGMQSMMQTMESPDFRATMEKRLGEMKEDPEVSKIMADIEQRGPAAMMKCVADAKDLCRQAAAPTATLC